MKLVIVLLTLSSAIPVTLSAETVEEIAGDIVFARGGQAKLASIQTERLTGQVIAGERQGSFVMELKRPNKIRMEIVLDGSKVVEASEGTSGWTVEPGGSSPRKLNDSEAKQLAADMDIDGPFVDYQRKGTKIEMIDKEMLGPSLVWKLKLTRKSGDVEYYCIETTGHFVLARERTLDQNSSNVQFYSDFRRVEDVLFPFDTTSQSSGPQGTLEFKVEKLDVNAVIDDAEFTEPTKTSK